MQLYLHARNSTITLMVSSSPQVFTDHKALEYMLEGNLNDKLYRWVLVLLKYNLDVKYIAGAENAAAEALTRLRHKIRLPDDVPSTLAHIRSIVDNQKHQVASEEHWIHQLKYDDEHVICNELTNIYEICLVQSETDITNKYKEKLGINQNIDLFTLEEAHPNYFSAQLAAMDSDLVQVHPSIDKPVQITDHTAKLRCMQSAHNLAYLSPGKMLGTIRQYVHWKGMKADIQSFFDRCHTCATWSMTTG